MNDDATHALDEQAQADAGLPDAIGPYRVIGLLGEGAMGRVYLARESHPPREVALKVVRGVSSAALERFRREIELLGQLEHPGIVRLYAAGEDAIGGLPSPWFALEVVRGPDLHGYLEQHKLDLRTRIGLLAKLARAVHYAHQRGIVHRDLKPSNVLVDEHGQPKILDFGIARLHGEDGGNMTQAGQVMGTLPYMSPEQLAGNTRDVDARSDVYALGAIGYELLSGRLPHPRLSTSTLFEALDIVRLEDPEPLERLNRDARGDLNLVVMKALSPEPAQRYASAAEFADDLEAVLDSRPVHAHAPTLGYRAARFVRRHRALTVAAGVVFASLLAATVVSALAAQRARAALAQAELRANELAAVNGFLNDMLQSADPEEGAGADISVREWLLSTDHGYQSQSGALPPNVRQSLSDTLGTALLHIDEPRRALERLRQSRELATRLYGATSDEAVATGVNEALAQTASGGDEKAAEAELQRLLELARRNGSAETQAQAGFALATLLEHRNQTQEAAKITADILDMTRRELGENSVAALTALNNRAASLLANGDYKAAEPLAREAWKRREALYGKAHPQTLAALNTLGGVLHRLGRMQEAEDIFRQVWEARRDNLGQRHPHTLNALNNLVTTLILEKKLKDAQPLMDQLAADVHVRFGDDDRLSRFVRDQRAWVTEELGNLDDAEAQYRDIVAYWQTRDERQPMDEAVARNNLAMLLSKRGKHAEAIATIDDVVAHAGTELGAEHPYMGIFRSNQGLILAHAGRRDGALAAFAAAQPILDAKLGPEHDRSKRNRDYAAKVRAGERLD